VNTVHRSRVAWIAVVAVVLLIAAACGGGDGDRVGDGDGDDADASEVVIELVAFKPEQLDVSAGTTVTWRNRDPGSHTVTAGVVTQGAAGVTPEPDGTFNSGELAEGDSFELRFGEPGTYRYFCSLHPATMRGEIRVA
jgi:plastocyanin